MKLSVSLPDELVKRIDEEAERCMSSRSGLIANACREYITSQEAKRLLPKLRAAIEVAAAGKQLTAEEQAQIDAFALLSKQF